MTVPLNTFSCPNSIVHISVKFHEVRGKICCERDVVEEEPVRRKHLLAESLSSLESRLNPARFLRIHRGRIVNLSRILAVHPLLSGTYELELRGGARLTSGRQHKAAIQAVLQNKSME